jgi:hypothetical protein
MMIKKVPAMKLSKIIGTLFLSVLLAVSVLCAGLLFNASQIFQRDDLASLVKEIRTGEKILEYEYLPEDVETVGIYDGLKQVIEPQVALAVNVSGDDAVICHNGAFAYVESLQDEKYAYTSLNPVAEDFGRGYTQTAVTDNIISPNKTMTYKNVKNERVWTKMEPLLLETITTKYRSVLDVLRMQGYFCSLDIDQLDTFAYLMRTGKESATIRNGLYHAIENKIGEIFDEHFLNYIDCLKDEGQTYETIAQQTLNETLLKEVYAYIHDQGFSDEKMDIDKANATLLRSISSHIAPKLYSCLPSYEDTVSGVFPTVLSLLRKVLNGSLTYICLAVAGAILLLMLLIGKKAALPFAGIALLLSGAAAFLSKSYSLKLTDYLTKVMTESGNDLSFLVPDLVNVFLNRFSTLGIYAAIAGAVLLLLGIVSGRKKAEAE